MILIIQLVLCAQAKRDTLTFVTSDNDHTKLSTLFDKQLNTYNLNSALKFERTWGNYSFLLDENFRSTVIKSNTKSIKDEHYFTFMNDYRLHPVFTLGLSLNNNVYSDDRKLAINKTSNFYTQIYSKITPVKQLEVIPFFGTAQNQQTAVTDKGYIYGSEAFINNYSIDNFLINSSLKFQNEDISPRKNTFRYLNLNVRSEFENNINNNAGITYTEQRRDFYFEADSLTSSKFDITNNIQSRTEDRLNIQNRLFFFSPTGRISFDINGDISWRSIDRNTRYVLLENVTQSSFDTKIEEFRINLSSSAFYRGDGFNGRLQISYSEKEEKHSPKMINGANSIFFEERSSIEKQKNNTSNRITLSGNGSWDISSNDKISLSLYHRKLMYDTPSGKNFDDRDELLSIVKLSYIRRLNYFFNVFMHLEGSLNKIAYIFAERSSNNNTKRIIKLSAGGTYESKYLRSVNSAEVSANYTVYKYEELNPNFKSFAFRQLVIRDSTLYKLSRKIKADFYGYMKFSEQGDFKWQNFTSQPVRYLTETYLEPKLFYMINNVELGVGLRYFNLSTYNYDNNIAKKLSSEYNSIGPLSEIRINMNDRLRLKLYGYYEFITTESNTLNQQANLNIQMSWYL